MPKKPDATGLPPEMPLAPGSRTEPVPQHVTAAEEEIPYLARDKQKWTRARVEATVPSPRPSKVGAPGVEDLPDAMDSIIPAPPAQRLPSPVKAPRRPS
jgi:hypothetical protein